MQKPNLQGSTIRSLGFMACLCVTFLTNGCQTDKSDGAVKSGTTHYYQYSWQDIIPDTCRVFFDGCNTCRRSPGSEVAACTHKACARYEKPICLDKALY